MRVRESEPSIADFLKWEESPDVIALTAYTLGMTVGDVLREYASKVGTWRQMETVTLERNKKWAPERQVHTVSRAFFHLLGEGLEGAPDWLRELTIAHWQTWLAAWEDQVIDDDVAAYITAVLNRALKMSLEPLELP